MSHSLRAKIKCLRYKGIITDKDCDRLRKALDNEDVLDKIRAEIAEIQLIGYATVDGKREIASRAVLQIIDKYRKEIAMTKQEDEQISFDGVFCDKSAMKKLGCLGNCIGCTHWAYDEDAKRKRCINPKLEKLKGDSE